MNIDPKYVPPPGLPIAPLKTEDPFEAEVKKQIKRLDFEAGAAQRASSFPHLMKKGK